ncbi:Ubiquitin-40S ribosomal protein S31, variant 2 [Ancistrocladus abbreviatus]
MASLAVGAASMASQFISLPSSIPFSKSQALGSFSFYSPPTSSCSNSAASPTMPLIYCGRGDRKTAKGKRFNHSFGNARPRDKKKGRGSPRVAIPPSQPKKDPFDDKEIIKIEIEE